MKSQSKSGLVPTRYQICCMREINADNEENEEYKNGVYDK
jgi:hypothetical protein